MSTRYDFMLMCNLRDDTPAQVVDTLKYMTRTEDYKFDNPPDDPVFESDWWRDAFRLQPEHRSMGTFTGDTIHIFRPDSRGGPNNTAIHFNVLQLRAIMHGDLLMSYLCFVNWLAQYSERFGFAGYYATEEALQPTLLYFNGGKLYITQNAEFKFASVAEWCAE